jgi:hypothetical protein
MEHGKTEAVRYSTQHRRRPLTSINDDLRHFTAVYWGKKTGLRIRMLLRLSNNFIVN